MGGRGRRENHPHVPIGRAISFPGSSGVRCAAEVEGRPSCTLSARRKRASFTLSGTRLVGKAARAEVQEVKFGWICGWDLLGTRRQSCFGFSFAARSGTAFAHTFPAVSRQPTRNARSNSGRPFRCHFGPSALFQPYKWAAAALHAAEAQENVQQECKNRSPHIAKPSSEDEHRTRYDNCLKEALLCTPHIFGDRCACRSKRNRQYAEYSPTINHGECHSIAPINILHPTIAFYPPLSSLTNPPSQTP